ncbi:ASCH domain-containing protein [Vibrio sp. UCD-FRSSP16_10]|uniref:N(4)-acetylcytidine aminohydrolase n=1 Tax=unclassified Vibrio TaxID=2614977 RepID=UPI0007FD2C0D|nr:MULTISPECIES: N(4)-acetylcytidine aminohydrolase [unclassified Vibrio]OBT13186.1 ASCH domain-containing protein [Vibrio sp. UCD-FRSSP16_30]OBT19588.1 ASCH domain-containing protein [Vibrio sp. UCD-FRSSP16_10]
MTFFERFETDILSGKKTITIRDSSECHYAPDSIVEVSTFEQGRRFCALRITSVTPILFDDLTDFHAEQENMTLTELKEVIADIYPGIKQLFVIKYELV